jgi:hypothetical protein
VQDAALECTVEADGSYESWMRDFVVVTPQDRLDHLSRFRDVTTSPGVRDSVGTERGRSRHIER